MFAIRFIEIREFGVQCRIYILRHSPFIVCGPAKSAKNCSRMIRDRSLRRGVKSKDHRTRIEAKEHIRVHFMRIRIGFHYSSRFPEHVCVNIILYDSRKTGYLFGKQLLMMDV